MHDDGCVDTVVLTHTPKLRQSGTLPPNFAITGYATERIELLTSTQLSTYTPSFDLRHPLPNVAITGYVTELALNSLPPRSCPPSLSAPSESSYNSDSGLVNFILLLPCFNSTQGK